LRSQIKYSDTFLYRLRGAIVPEIRRLARIKRLKPAPASSFPELARYLGITDPAEDIRAALKVSLQELEREEEEAEDNGDGEESPYQWAKFTMKTLGLKREGQDWPLARPAMALLGLTPRSEHKGIGARQELAAKARGVAVATMRRHEVKIAEELGWYLHLSFSH
jgi:hypothetical protein